MKGDLLIITPSRGRPQNIIRLLNAIRDTCRMETHLVIGVDDDDPQLPRYKELQGPDDDFMVIEGPRRGLAAWTNNIASVFLDDYPYLASLGDDMIPRTPGWDKQLIKAIERMGGTGFSYPWDYTREDIPEAVVMSSDIVRALGWMCMPDLSHWFVDTVWADLGRGAGCIKHLRAISVEHDWKSDQLSKESGKSFAADRTAYYLWRKERMADDIRTIMRLREKIPEPA